MTKEKAFIILNECRLGGFARTLYTKDEYRTAMDMAIEALKKLSDIQQIIESPVYIQEDVIRYKMICEIMGE